jgi:cbb3-type cytochrome oxidase subunit 3
MKLSDIMGNAGLSGFAEVALVIFVVVFAAVVVRTFLPSRHREMERARHLPLDDGAAPSSPSSTTARTREER